MASETRGRTIPRVAWWCELATATEAASGKTRQQLADDVYEVFGYRTDDTGVVRCLSGRVLSLTLAEHLSALLKIPPPAIIPTSEAEAWALLGRREVERIRAQVGVMSGRVEQRHPDPVSSPDGAMGREPKRKRGRVDGGRKRPPEV